MGDEEKSKIKLVESLCVEINRAIIGSQDVKSCIKTLRSFDLLDRVQGCNLVLEMEMVLCIGKKRRKK
jgi:hypothetical protein